MIPNACYVHIRADAGAAAGIAEHLADMGDIAGVAVIGGDWDLLTCVAQPWEIASGLILDRIQADPGRPAHEHARLDRVRGARGRPGPVQRLELRGRPVSWA